MASGDLKRFIEQSNNMLESLLEICPDDKDLKVYYHKFEAVRSMNSQIIILAFIKYIYPYRKYILTNREEFEKFITGVDLKNEIANNEEIVRDIKDANFNNDIVLTKALNLKKIWEQKLNEENKDVLFTYFQVLTKLCDRYIMNKTGVNNVNGKNKVNEKI